MSGVSNANIRDYVNFEFPCICSFYDFIATNVGLITKIRVETTDFTKKTRIRKRMAHAEVAEARREEWWGRTAGVPDCFFRGAYATPRVGVGDPPTPFCCGKTRAIALRAKGPSRMCGAGLATVAERRSRTAAASRPYRFFAFSAGRRKPHPGRARSPERENPWDPWVNCFSELTTNFTKKTRIRK